MKPNPALALLLPLAAWACHAPLGAKYATVMSAVLLSLACLLSRVGRLADWAREPATWAALALWLLLALSLAWTPVPLPVALGQLGQYTLPLLLGAVAAACPAVLARRALVHFVAASALAACVFVLAAASALPDWPRLWHSTAQAEGNQRIAASILLALGAALALWLSEAGTVRVRIAWLTLALLCGVALALQDRRSGMLLLPLLLLVWAWSVERRWTRRALALLAVVALVAASWQMSATVRHRFDEGWRELREYRANDQVATSWGQRLRMWQLTADMVAERPLLGHGVGSWKQRWTERVTAGTPLAANTTPHSEYLLLAQQAGLLAPLLWLAWLAAVWRQAWRAGTAGVPALLAVAALAWTGLFNAVLRDAKFALPLLLLAALGIALSRGQRNTVRDHQRSKPR